MKKYIVALLVVLSLSKVMVCSAQTTIQERNVMYLDSVEKELKFNFCSNILSYPESYKPAKLKEDKKILLLFNELILNDYSLNTLSKLITKNKKAKIKIEEKKNGLINIVYFFLRGNLITTELKLEVIDSFIYRKTFTISTLTNGKCGESSFRLLDFGLLKKFFIDDVLFKVKFRSNQLEANYYNAEILLKSSVNHPAFKFNLPTSINNDFTNTLYSNQYNDDSALYYNYLKAPIDFVLLIRNKKNEVLKTLLFSPNYIYAINAMEAILYLGSKNEINLDEESIKKQIEILKNGVYPITIKKAADLFMIVNGYAELKMQEGLIIKKYESSF